MSILFLPSLQMLFWNFKSPSLRFTLPFACLSFVSLPLLPYNRRTSDTHKWYSQVILCVIKIIMLSQNQHFQQVDITQTPFLFSYLTPLTTAHVQTKVKVVTNPSKSKTKTAKTRCPSCRGQRKQDAKTICHKAYNSIMYSWNAKKNFVWNKIKQSP